MFFLLTGNFLPWKTIYLTARFISYIAFHYSRLHIGLPNQNSYKCILQHCCSLNLFSLTHPNWNHFSWSNHDLTVIGCAWVVVILSSIAHILYLIANGLCNHQRTTIRLCECSVWSIYNIMLINITVLYVSLAIFSTYIIFISLS